eukprot:m.15131 g.15131  ORF g.15131 m.15131 type:complete len:288 (+) comp6617_c0_seq2:58-921(+)
MAGRAFLGQTAPGSLRILFFNVLADGLAQFGDFSFTEPSWLTWEYRFPRLLAEIKGATADIVCLAELNHAEDSWVPAMRELGFEALISPKENGPASKFGAPSDGVGLFYRTSRVALTGLPLKSANDPVFQFAFFRDLQTEKHFAVATTHLKAKVEFADKRQAQVHNLLTQINAHATSTGLSPDRLIVCGDCNGEQQEPFYKAFTEQCSLIDAYQFVLGQGNADRFSTWKYRGNPPKGLRHTIDYIFTTKAIKAVGVLDWAVPLDPERALPSATYSSDHISVGADLVL